MKRATTAGALLFILCSAVRAQTPVEAPLTLAELERIALEKNPTLVQANDEVEAAKGRAKQAGLLPNPTVGYSADEFAFRAGEGRGKQGVFVEQRLPLGGKLGLSRAVFEQEVREAEANREAQRLRVVNSVRSLYYEALIAQRRVGIREDLARLSQEAVDVSRQLVNVGAADKPDLLESEIEAREANLALVDSRNQRYHTWLALATMVGEPGVPLRVLVLGEETVLPELNRDREVARLLSDSPQVLASKARIERADLSLRRARRENVPDLFLKGGSHYDRERNAETGRAVGWEGFIEAGISIPLFNQNQGNIAAARAQLERARAESKRVELALRGQLSGIFERYLTSLRSADEYRAEILPRAEQAYRLYLDRFREMGAAYPQVLIAQRTLFQTAGRYLSALEEAHRAAIQIQGLLLVDGLEAPPAPGEGTMGVRAGELPGVVRSGELPVAVRPPEKD
jgi:cobalt-zinc-cadmium efflux system outer membrane protein